MSRTLLPLSFVASLYAGVALADAPRVVVDIAPVHSLVARVMEGAGAPDLIMPAGATPHAYALRPSEAAALQASDIVFWVGAELTPWLDGAIDALSQEARVVTLLDAHETHVLPLREGALFEAHVHEEDEHAHEEHGHDEEGHDEHGHDDHGHDEHEHDEHGHDEHGHEEHEHDEHGHEEHGHEEHGHDEHGHDEHGHDEHGHDEPGHDEHGHDEHGHDEPGHDEHGHSGSDPHVWLSPKNASNWVTLIAAELSKIDPENAGLYFANATAARDEIAALYAEVSAQTETLPGIQFIVFHDAYQYFEHDFDLAAAGAISISDANTPSPARLREIQDRIRADGVDCVLSEPQFNPGLVEVILDGTAAKTAVLDPLGASLEPGAALYPQLLRDMAAAFASCR